MFFSCEIELEWGEDYIYSLVTPIMSTSFTWKEKSGRQRKAVVQVAASFNEESDEEDVELQKEEVDWLTAAKRRKVLLLEDCQAKSKRLKEEGTILAENER